MSVMPDGRVRALERVDREPAIRERGTKQRSQQEFHCDCLVSGSLARADLDPPEQPVDGGELAPTVLVSSRHQRHELGDLGLRGVPLLARARASSAGHDGAWRQSRSEAGTSAATTCVRAGEYLSASLDAHAASIKAAKSVLKNRSDRSIVPLWRMADLLDDGVELCGLALGLLLGGLELGDGFVLAGYDDVEGVDRPLKPFLVDPERRHLVFCGLGAQPGRTGRVASAMKPATAARLSQRPGSTTSRRSPPTGSGESCRPPAPPRARRPLIDRIEVFEGGTIGDRRLGRWSQVAGDEAPDREAERRERQRDQEILRGPKHRGVLLHLGLRLAERLGDGIGVGGE